MSLKYKVKDNILYGSKLRKMRNQLRGRIEDSLGSSSHAYKKLMKDVKMFCDGHRKKLKLKNDKKVKHLIQKYGMEEQRCGWDTLSKGRKRNKVQRRTKKRRKKPKQK